MGAPGRGGGGEASGQGTARVEAPRLGSIKGWEEGPGSRPPTGTSLRQQVEVWFWSPCDPLGLRCPAPGTCRSPILWVGWGDLPAASPWALALAGHVAGPAHWVLLPTGVPGGRCAGVGGEGAPCSQSREAAELLAGTTGTVGRGLLALSPRAQPPQLVGWGSEAVGEVTLESWEGSLSPQCPTSPLILRGVC